MYKFKVGDTVEVFEDVLTQHKHEGVGKIVKIHKQDKEVADVDVRFYVDVFSGKKMEDDIVRRQIKVPATKRNDVSIKDLLA